jgi:hypothetical protein
MAQKTKVFAPEGYHFMKKKNGNFYLMKGEYTAHTLSNGDKSSEYIMMQYLLEHPTSSVSSTATTSTRTTRTVSSTATRTVSRSTTSPTRSAGSSGSSGSSGGGY